MKLALAGGALVLLLPGCLAPKSPSGQSPPEVFVFIASDCPLSNSYAPELNRMIAEYSPRGIRFSLLYVDPDLGLEGARRHAKDYGYLAPVVWDSSHQWVERWGIHVTPEVVVLLPDQTVAYRGRIDDRVLDLGRKRPEPTRRDLRDALDAVLAGRPVKESSTPAVGCYIPERR